MANNDSNENTNNNEIENKTKASNTFQKGLTQFENAEFEKAKQYFDETLKLNKKHDLAISYLDKSKNIIKHLNKANKLFDSERYEEAAKSYKIILKQMSTETENSNIMLKQIECYIFSENIEQAENIFKKISNNKINKSINFYYIKGLLSYYKGQTKEAEISFKNVIQLNKTHGKAPMMLEKSKNLEELKLRCNKLFNNKDYEKAISAYTAAIKKSSEIDNKNQIFQSILWHNRGLSCRKSKNFKSSIDDFTNALRCNPKYLKALKQRAFLYNYLGEYQKSIEDYTAALEIRKCQDIQDELSRVESKLVAKNLFEDAVKKFKACKIDSAIILFERTLKWNPEHPKAKEYLEKSKNIKKIIIDAEKFIQSGHFKNAVRTYDSIIKLYPENNKDVVRIKKAECYILMQQIEKAEKIIKSVSSEVQNTLDYYYVYGLYFYYKADLEKAKIEFEKASAVDKCHKKSQKMIENCEFLESIKENGNSSYKKRLYKKARSEYSDAINQSSKFDSKINCFQSLLFRNRALTESKLKNLEACIEDCTKALELNPNYFNALVLRARTYKTLDNIELSVNDYKAALNISNIDEKQSNLIKAENKVEAQKAYAKSEEHLESGNINEAIKYLGKTLLWDPQHSKANENTEKLKRLQNDFSKAEQLIENGQFEEVLKIYEGIIKYCPKDFNEQIKLKQAECFFLKGRYDKVAEILNSSSTSLNKIKEFYYVNGLYKYYKGLLSEAKQNFENSYNLDKNYKNSFNMLEKCKSLLSYIDKAETLLENCIYQEAIDQLSKGIISMTSKTDQKDYAILCYLYYKRANIHLIMNNRNACAADCANALQLDKKYWQALYLRAKIHKSSGNLIQCISDCEEALEFTDSHDVRTLLIESEIELNKATSTSMTHYDALGISQEATDQQIRSAFRKKALKYHPDKYSKFPNKLKIIINNLMQKTNGAYETLRDKTKRKKYDDEIKTKK